MPDNFKYEVAFSFLQQDEEVAVRLSGLLQGRLSTFIYSKKQGEIAGTDGEKTFNQVFGEEARIVVVLYREGWGATPWTRIEETAIRNRGYESGYDFVTLIILEKGQRSPVWLPKNRLWVGLERVGLEGTATVIESRVQEAGGAPREETSTDRANRLGKSLQIKKENAAFLESEAGVKAAGKEIEELFSETEKLANEVSKTTSAFKIQVKKDRGQFAVYAEGCRLSVYHGIRYTNTLSGAQVTAEIYAPHEFRSIAEGRSPALLKRERFDFALNMDKRFVWGKEQRSTPQLAEFLIHELIKKAEEQGGR